jgi:hypothetical protein
VASFLKITRHPYEEPHHLNLVVQASNGTQTGSLEIYTTPEALLRSAEALRAFPRHSTDVFLWEIGSERPEDRWAFYFRFRVFLTAPTGESAIHFRFNNNRDLPERQISEFCLTAEPSQINRLGKLLQEFASLQHEILFWRVKEGELLTTPTRGAPAA